MLHILYTYCAGKIENSVTRHLSEQQQQLTRLDVKAAHKRKVWAEHFSIHPTTYPT